MALPNNPITRKEMYLSNMAGQGTALPDEPITREEEYLDYIAKNGGGGGTGDGDMKKSVYDSDAAVSTVGGIKAFVNAATSALQPKTLDTPITIGGESMTTVEAALGALEDNKEDTILAATPLVKEYDEVMRQDVLRLTMDDTPTASSNNPVKSGGVKSAVTATVDLLKDTTGWTGKNKAVFHGKGIYDLSTGVYTPLDPTNYGAWKKVSCKGGEKFVFVCNNAINQVIWYEWNGNTFISATPHSDLTSSYDEYTVGSNTTLVACVARLTGGNITDDSDFGNPMIADAVVYSLDPSYEPYHESVEDWYWSENAKKSVHNIFNPALFISSADANMATVNSDGSSIRVKVDSPSTFRLCAWYLNVTPNTDYTVKTSVAITAGKCAIKAETIGGTNIKTSNALSADGVIEMTFNSGNNTQLKFDIFCTWDVSEIGDITCNNLFIKETADTYNNFLPFAMTNRQLTEKVTAINAELNKNIITDSTNNTTFNIPLVRKSDGYTYGEIIGNNFLYHFFINTPSAQNAVTFNKIYDNVDGRTFSGSYANGVFTITSSATIYGGLMVITNNV